MSRSKNRLKVFIAHSGLDKVLVRDVFCLLRLDGFEPWLDEESLIPGQDWEYEIKKAIGHTDVVVVFVSRHSVDRAGYLHKELSLAIDIAEKQPQGRIFIIPIRLDDCELPDRLKHLHSVDFFQGDAFSIGPMYLRLQWALTIRSFELFDMNIDDLLLSRKTRIIWMNTAKLQRGSRQSTKPGLYLLRGRNPDGSKYYGTAVISSEGCKTKLTARIGAHVISYRSEGDSPFHAVDGEHSVNYIWRPNNILFGEWGDGGIEELIPASPSARGRDTTSEA